MKVLITTVPFGEKDRYPVDLLEKYGVDYLVNPLGKKLTEEELSEMVSDVDVIIAGTEPITRYVLERAPQLKMISRVGIGLDSVDLMAARERGIKVSYTPDAPAPAVAELTIGLMLSLLRYVHVSNMELHLKHWKRYFGRRLSECTIGIVGVGRIGKGVIRHLSGFQCKKVLVNDLYVDRSVQEYENVEYVDKETLYQESDVLTFHVPLTASTKNMIRREHLDRMKPDAIIINTSRGGIVNESDLYNTMNQGHLSGAAIDVFEEEPYSGNLTEIDHCMLTSHMGSMSIDCRNRMEIEATEEVIRYITKQQLLGSVPEEEYEVQRQGL